MMLYAKAILIYPMLLSLVLIKKNKTNKDVVDDETI